MAKTWRPLTTTDMLVTTTGALLATTDMLLTTIGAILATTDVLLTYADVSLSYAGYPLLCTVVRLFVVG